MPLLGASIRWSSEVFQKGQWIKKYKLGPQFGIVKLVNITPISQWFMVYITIVNGVYVHQLIARMVLRNLRDGDFKAAPVFEFRTSNVVNDCEWRER